MLSIDTSFVPHKLAIGFTLIVGIVNPMFRTWGHVQYLLKEHTARLPGTGHIRLAAVISSEVGRTVHYNLLYTCTFACVALLFQGTHGVDAGCVPKVWYC